MSMTAGFVREKTLRRFHSYGPVDAGDHFCVPRESLVASCTDQMLGDIEKGGRYFTIWAPRQTGKTWLMREVKKEIARRHGERFMVGFMSMQGVILDEGDSMDGFLDSVPRLMRHAFGFDIETPPDRLRCCNGRPLHAGRR